MATYKGKHYRLRAGSPMPTSIPGQFVFHTFMATTQNSVIDTCTTVIPKSYQFSGQGGNYITASFSRLPVSTVGAELFKGKTTDKNIYGDEDSWGFN